MPVISANVVTADAGKDIRDSLMQLGALFSDLQKNKTAAKTTALSNYTSMMQTINALAAQWGGTPHDYIARTTQGQNLFKAAMSVLGDATGSDLFRGNKLDEFVNRIISEDPTVLDKVVYEFSRAPDFTSQGQAEKPPNPAETATTPTTPEKPVTPSTPPKPTGSDNTGSGGSSNGLPNYWWPGIESDITGKAGGSTGVRREGGAPARTAPGAIQQGIGQTGIGGRPMEGAGYTAPQPQGAPSQGQGQPLVDNGNGTVTLGTDLFQQIGALARIGGQVVSQAQSQGQGNVQAQPQVIPQATPQENQPQAAGSSLSPQQQVRDNGDGTITLSKDLATQLAAMARIGQQLSGQGQQQVPGQGVMAQGPSPAQQARTQAQAQGNAGAPYPQQGQPGANYAVQEQPQPQQQATPQQYAQTRPWESASQQMLQRQQAEQQLSDRNKVIGSVAPRAAAQAPQAAPSIAPVAPPLSSAELNVGAQIAEIYKAVSGREITPEEGWSQRNATLPSGVDLSYVAQNKDDPRVKFALKLAERGDLKPLDKVMFAIASKDPAMKGKVVDRVFWRPTTNFEQAQGQGQIIIQNFSLPIGAPPPEGWKNFQDAPIGFDKMFISIGGQSSAAGDTSYQAFEQGLKARGISVADKSPSSGIISADSMALSLDGVMEKGQMNGALQGTAMYLQTQLSNINKQLGTKYFTFSDAAKDPKAAEMIKILWAQGVDKGDAFKTALDIKNAPSNTLLTPQGSDVNSNLAFSANLGQLAKTIGVSVANIETLPSDSPYYPVVKSMLQKISSAKTDKEKADIVTQTMKTVSELSKQKPVEVQQAAAVVNDPNADQTLKNAALQLLGELPDLNAIVIDKKAQNAPYGKSTGVYTGPQVSQEKAVGVFENLRQFFTGSTKSFAEKSQAYRDAAVAGSWMRQEWHNLDSQGRAEMIKKLTDYVQNMPIEQSFFAFGENYATMVANKETRMLSKAELQIREKEAIANTQLAIAQQMTASAKMSADLSNAVSKFLEDASATSATLRKDAIAGFISSKGGKVDWNDIKTKQEFDKYMETSGAYQGINTYNALLQQMAVAGGFDGLAKWIAMAQKNPDKAVGWLGKLFGKTPESGGVSFYTPAEQEAAAARSSNQGPNGKVIEDLVNKY